MNWRWLFPWLKRGPAHLATGQWGEAEAERLLRKKGLSLVGRRVRVDRDEIDLIMRAKQTLVFVEVKTRKSEDFGRPIESVNRAKRHRLSRAAVRYLKGLRAKPAYIRFDVVEVIGQPGAGAPRLVHIENAFALSSGYRLPW
ncbi:MAG: YraN family protein [Kiritimatiellae bacterium]|nr:YraN family protein [Kiritimatiellia bacterium]